jgi:UDP-N-acetylglucosamine--N-acetylmuramyl-(pentapeptide) pyrophosphoryl-undecaprenol N-acetylglucosamine transferase
MTAGVGSGVVLAAGGTGGHMFPAEALAGELVERGLLVDLVTDRRGQGFGDRIGRVTVHRISAGGIAGGSVVRRARSVAQLGIGFFQARAVLARLSPAVAVGFGGYASVPTMLAASLAGVPTVLHEQNAILGRANRLLARRATRIAASFEGIGEDSLAGKIVVTGNPVRSAIAAIGDAPYAAPAAQGEVRLLVTGGSQGARIFARLVPAAVALLSQSTRARLVIAQQCRAEDLESVTASYRSQGVQVELSPFFTDMPERLRAAHLVICRSGASTVAELCAAGRPAILVPYPHAADDHQTANAKAVERADSGWLMPEASTSPERLATMLGQLMADAGRLADVARAALKLARRDAAARLADLAQSLARGNGHHRPDRHSAREAA